MHAFVAALPIPCRCTAFSPRRKKFDSFHSRLYATAASPATKEPWKPGSDSNHRKVWTPHSWRTCDALQQPLYDDAEALAAVESRLSLNPPLVFPGEIERLRARLADAACGRSFVLQGGDCAESFEHFSTDSIAATFRVLVAMSVALSYLSGLHVVKLGRIAGQFAKPRSAPYEKSPSGEELPSFRGDIINSPEMTHKARAPDPERIIRAYSQSASSLNMLRALAKSSDSMLEWVELIARLAPDHYSEFVDRIDDAIAFTTACGVSVDSSTEMREPEFYSSHEALLLPYEQAMVRSRDNPSTGRTEYHCSSAHFLWVGERTRQLEGAHVEFLRGLRNPLGIKVGPTIETDELLRLIEVLDPLNESGRLTLIVRMGADKIGSNLPKLVRAVRDAGRRIIWSIDAMHGNTVKTSYGTKTRPFGKILSEIDTFFQVHEAEGTLPGGVHLEMTGDEDITECLGGTVLNISEDDLTRNFKSACDPRLNG